MNYQDEKLDRDMAIALVFFSAALLERCEALLARVSSKNTVLEEIEAFREAALRHVSVVPANAPNEDYLAGAIKIAREHVDEICDAWLLYGRS